jgi:hypothetical protein
MTTPLGTPIASRGRQGGRSEKQCMQKKQPSGLPGDHGGMPDVGRRGRGRQVAESKRRERERENRDRSAFL